MAFDIFERVPIPAFGHTKDGILKPRTGQEHRTLRADEDLHCSVFDRKTLQNHANRTKSRTNVLLKMKNQCLRLFIV